MRSLSVINPTPVIFVFPNLFNLETLYTTFCIVTTSVFLFFAFFRQGDGRTVCKRGEVISFVMLGVSTGQREIVAYKSIKNKKKVETGIPDLDSFSFLYEVLSNDFPTVDTPRRPCYHSPNEKSKNTRGGDGFN